MGDLRYLGVGTKPEVGENQFKPGSHCYIWFSTEEIYRPAFIAKDSNNVLRAYTGRSGDGSSTNPYVYTGEIEDIKQGTKFVDAGGGNVYRADPVTPTRGDPIQLQLNKIDMSGRIDYNKGYVADGKFYTDQEHTKEATPTYGGVFLDLTTGNFYINDVDGEGKLGFVQADLGEKVEFEVEIPCYYNYHQGADADGASIDTMLKGWTIRETVCGFDGVLSWYNGPNLAPIGGAVCFNEYK